MDIFGFIVTIIVVTASGALAPGPLFFVNIAHGTKSGAKGGLAFSIGHTIIEFSLVMFLALGLLAVVNEPAVGSIVGVIGGIFLVAFGVLQVYQFLVSKSEGFGGKSVSSRNPLLLGSIFTGLNPYFIIWWLTVGLKLIADSISWGSSHVRRTRLDGLCLAYIHCLSCEEGDQPDRKQRIQNCNGGFRRRPRVFWALLSFAISW